MHVVDNERKAPTHDSRVAEVIASDVYISTDLELWGRMVERMEGILENNEKKVFLESLMTNLETANIQ